MGLSKNVVVVKVAVLLFLMGFTATVDARFHTSSFLTQVFKNGDTSYYYLSKSKSSSSSSSACCDACACTKSIPPQCHCFDIGETCHSACENCICALSYPPQCRCVDVTKSCLEACSSSDAKITH